MLSPKIRIFSPGKLLIWWTLRGAIGTCERCSQVPKGRCESGCGALALNWTQWRFVWSPLRQTWWRGPKWLLTCCQNEGQSAPGKASGCEQHKMEKGKEMGRHFQGISTTVVEHWEEQSYRCKIFPRQSSLGIWRPKGNAKWNWKGFKSIVPWCKHDLEWWRVLSCIRTVPKQLLWLTATHIVSSARTRTRTAPPGKKTVRTRVQTVRTRVRTRTRSPPQNRTELELPPRKKLSASYSSSNSTS